jgi:hypothetical protein
MILRTSPPSGENEADADHCASAPALSTFVIVAQAVRPASEQG